MSTQTKKLKLTFFILLILFLGISFFATKAQAYAPPIGIPDPGMWGSTHPIDTPAPSTAQKCPNWPANETAGCYYIDNTNPNATDSGNIYGYPNKPRITIPAGTYAAGAYVEVHGGPYTTEKTIVLAGTSENPVWFKGTPGSMPDMKAKISIKNSTYAVIEYLDFNGFSGGCIDLSASMLASNVSIRNNTFRNMTFPIGAAGSALMGATPIQNGSIHDIVYYNNTMTDIGDWQALDDQDYHGINPSLWGRKPPTTVYNIWSLSNTAIRISGSLQQFNGDQRDASAAAAENPPRPITNTNLQNFHHMYSGKNIMHNCRQGSGGAKFTTDAIFSQNTAYSNYSTSSAAGTGQVYQEGAKYVWIIFNRFYDLTYGVRQSNTNFPGVEDAGLRSYMIGNVIYDIHNKQAKPYGDTSQFKPAQGIGFEKGGYIQRMVVDNTIYDVGGGVNIGNNSTYGNTQLSGNVIAGVKGIDDNGDPDFHASLLDLAGTAGMDYGFFQPRADNGTVTFKWAGGIPSSTINGLASYKSSTNHCEHCYEGDPLFINPAIYDLHPQASSPLIGKGVRNEAYDIFQQRYGINIAVDFDGNPRPTSNTGWTLGAYEYDEGYVPPAATCSDNLQNQNETGVDCGGVCSACVTPTTYNLTNLISTINHWLQVGDASSNVNGDNIVNTKDLGIMMSGWSQ